MKSKSCHGVLSRNSRHLLSPEALVTQLKNNFSFDMRRKKSVIRLWRWKLGGSEEICVSESSNNI